MSLDWFLAKKESGALAFQPTVSMIFSVTIKCSNPIIGYQSVRAALGVHLFKVLFLFMHKHPDLGVIRDWYTVLYNAYRHVVFRGASSFFPLSSPLQLLHSMLPLCWFVGGSLLVVGLLVRLQRKRCCSQRMRDCQSEATNACVHCLTQPILKAEGWGLGPVGWGPFLMVICLNITFCCLLLFCFEKAFDCKLDIIDGAIHV